MQSDPIGLQGGINTYLYAFARPSVLFDPFGLDSIRSKVVSAIGRGDTRRLRSLIDAIGDPKVASLARDGIRQLTSKADDFIGEVCKASFRREFPKQHLNRSVEEIYSLARGGDRSARTARKLLTDKRLRK